MDEGKITISRVTSNVRDDVVNVTLVYGGKHIVGSMALEDYARCVTGLARQPIVIEEN